MNDILSEAQSSDDDQVVGKRVAASRTQDQKIILISGGDQSGKQNAKHPKCEDAYFISENSFGLSDGVSGWNDYGFSSEEFSNQLMKNAKELLEQRFQTEFLKPKESFKLLSSRLIQSVKIKFKKSQSQLTLKEFYQQKESTVQVKSTKNGSQN